MNVLGFLLGLNPLIGEFFYDHVIIIRQKLGRGERTVLERGKRVKKKDGKHYMKFMITGMEKVYPPLECITPLKSNKPVNWFGGKYVECTLINDEITWLSPSVKYTTFECIDSQEMKLHTQQLMEAVAKYDIEKDKQDPLERWLPVFVQIFALIFFLLGMMWVLNNGGEEMYSRIIEGFKQGASIAGDVGSLGDGISGGVPLG